MKRRVLPRSVFGLVLGLSLGMLPIAEGLARDAVKPSRGAQAKADKAGASAGARSVVKRKTSTRKARKSGSRRVHTVAFVPSRPSIGQAIGLHRVADPLELRSSVAYVLDARTREPLYEKNADAVLPIASITKLLTAMVVIDARLPMEEPVEIDHADIDSERHSASRLRPGSRVTRGELLQLALMASENRAASALGRTYPGGMSTFVGAMNAKARAIGMSDSSFADPTGLSSANVANARDLARLVLAAHEYPLLRRYSTAPDLTVDTGRRQLRFRNTNRLVDSDGWNIGLQKTGYISEAGRCLVMQVDLDQRPVVIVLLDSAGKYSRFGDAGRLRRYLEDVAGRPTRPPAAAVAAVQARAS